MLYPEEIIYSTIKEIPVDAIPVDKLIEIICSKETITNKYSDTDIKEFILIYSCELGYCNVVHYLINGGVNVCAKGDSALKWSVAEGHLEIVRFLVDRGANINASYDPIWICAIKGHLDIASFLIQQGAKISYSALRASVNFNYPEIVKLLIKNGATVKDDSLLHYSCEKGYLRVVKLLLNTGLDKELVLELACKNGHLEIVRFLAEDSFKIILQPISNTDIPKNDNILVAGGVGSQTYSEKALLLAAQYGQLHILQFLVEDGASIFSQDHLLLRSSIKYNNLQIINYLAAIYLVRNCTIPDSVINYKNNCINRILIKYSTSSQHKLFHAKIVSEFLSQNSTNNI